jgi:predicted nucleotidyltransferase
LIEKIPSKKFIIHGSVALGFYGEPRDSTDIDIMTNLKPFEDYSNVTEILDNTEFKEVDTKITEDGLVRKFKAGDWSIDVFEVDSKLFRKIKSRAIQVKWRNKIIYIISVEDLIKFKKRRGSPQDLVDIQNLLKEE